MFYYKNISDEVKRFPGNRGEAYQLVAPGEVVESPKEVKGWYAEPVEEELAEPLFSKTEEKDEEEKPKKKKKGFLKKINEDNED